MRKGAFDSDQQVENRHDSRPINPKLSNRNQFESNFSVTGLSLFIFNILFII